MRTDASIRPLLAAALGVALFSILDAMMKVIATTYPIAQSTGMRYFAGAIIATSFFMFTKEKWPNRAAIMRSIPRTVTILIAGTCFFVAISRLSLVDATILTFLSPLFLSLWGWLLLKESIEKQSIFAIFVGLIGVILVVRGQSDAVDHSFDMIGVVAAICTAALYALSLAITRHHSAKDALPTLVLLPNVIGALLSAPTMIYVWEPITFWHMQLLFYVGIMGTAGYICLAWAYSMANVGRLGMFDYTGLVWAGVIGFLIFNEAPSIWSIAGAILIIGACTPVFFGKQNK